MIGQRRLLLPLVAIATFGAYSVSTVLANPTASDSTAPSASVGVVTPVGVADLTLVSPSIPANGTPQLVSNVMGHDADTNYQLRVDPGALSITNQGSSSGTCTGLSPSPHSVTETGLPHLFDHNFGPLTQLGELRATMPPTVNNNCLVGGAVVQVIFTAVGPDVP